MLDEMASGGGAELVRLPGLSLDVDTPADLDAAIAVSSACRGNDARPIAISRRRDATAGSWASRSSRRSPPAIGQELIDFRMVGGFAQLGRCLRPDFRAGTHSSGRSANLVGEIGGDPYVLG